MKNAKLNLILALTIFGTIGLLRRYIPYSSELIAFVRGFIGVLVLLAWQLAQAKSFPKEALRANFKLLVTSGVLIGINWILLFEAYQRTTVSVATICYYMAPVFVILASSAVLGEQLTLKKGACALVAVLGMVLVSGVLETGFTGLSGVACALAAACLYAIVIMLNKKIQGLSANDRTIFQLGAAALALLPYLLATENFAALKFDGVGIALLLVAGIIHTGFAYTIYFGSISRVPAQTVAIFSYIDPIVAVLLSALVLHEALSLPALIGVVLVIGSTLLSEL